MAHVTPAMGDGIMWVDLGVCAPTDEAKRSKSDSISPERGWYHMALAKHLTQKSVSKGLRVYNTWALAFGKPSCNMAQYLARQDVQGAYPLTTPLVASPVVDEDVVLNGPIAQNLVRVIAEAQAMLAALQAAPAIAELPAETFTRSTPARKATKRTQVQAVRPALSKPSLFKPWAIEKFGIGAVGTTFTYVSKRAQEAHTFQVLKLTKDGATCVRVG